jgi:membrane protease YdiL (CAAX protease family)
MSNDQSDLTNNHGNPPSQGSNSGRESSRQPGDSLMLPVHNLKDKPQTSTAKPLNVQVKEQSSPLLYAAGISQPIPVTSPPIVKVPESRVIRTNNQTSEKPTLISRNQLITWIAIYFIAITTAETLTILLDTVIFGLVFYGLVLVALMMFSAAFAGHREQRIFLTLAFAPLIRLISMSVPMDGVPVMYRYTLVGAPIFISIFLVAIYAGFKREEMGLTLKNLPVQLLIAPMGIALGYIEYLILRPKPLVSEFSINSLLVPAIILLVFTGLLEELVFRGMMQRAFMTELGTWGGLFFVASVFAVLHFGYLSVLDVIFVFSVAVIFGIITLYSGSVLGVTIAHGLTNLTLFLIFPFLLGQPVTLTFPTTGHLRPPPVVWVAPTKIAFQDRISGTLNNSTATCKNDELVALNIRDKFELVSQAVESDPFVFHVNSNRQKILIRETSKYEARSFL